MKESKNIAARICTVWFCVLLAAPLLGHVLSNRGDVSALEKRKLAEPPSWEMLSQAPTKAPQAVNNWLNDRFGFREPLVRLDFALRDLLDLNNNTAAIRGDNGWLFNNIEDSVAMHQGRLPYSEGEADAWIDGVETLKSMSCGKPFAVLVVPNKHTIYPEHLTDYPRRLSGETRLETLESSPRANSINFIRIRDELLRAKKDEQVYYKTDTHWTLYGGYLAYQKIMETYRQLGLVAGLVNAERLGKNGVRQHNGDIYGLLGVEGKPEEVDDWIIQQRRPVLKRENTPAYEWESFEAYQMTMTLEEKPSLLIFGDSFANMLIPFLQQSFGKITYAHHRNVNPPVRLLASCDYDAVLFQMVERTLSYPVIIESAAQ